MTSGDILGQISIADFLVKEAVLNALKEDIGVAGDVTTNALIPESLKCTGHIIARQDGVFAGLQFAQHAFLSLASETLFEISKQDGDYVRSGEIVASVTGPARALLTAERVALNYLCHLSGIATLTHQFVQKVAGTSAQICDTRKTTPNLRAFEKYAVRVGGGANHRFGLYDAVMIKDNHIALAGGIEQAIQRAKSYTGHMVKIEIEVDTLEQLDLVLQHDIDVVLLDNMSIEQLRDAVLRVNKRCITEASGGVTLETVEKIAQTGVDLISVGALTHSAPILDLGLDFV